jgi:DNA replication protein DnaC
MLEPYWGAYLKEWIYPECPCIADRELEESRKAQIAERLAACKFGRRFVDSDFSTFEAANDGDKKALNKAMEYVERFNDSSRGLLFLGPCGTGKTHLAVAITKALIQKAVEVAFVTVAELLSSLRATYDDTSRISEQNILDHMGKVPMLVLDDLGAEKVTDWTKDRLYLIVDRRYREARPIIVTTNCDVKELEDHVGMRVFSRLHEMCEGVPMRGQDRRKLRRAQ